MVAIISIFAVYLASCLAEASDSEFCSTINTGSSSDATFDSYQSSGACRSSCSGYAYGIVQYSNCWCSNYAPSSTVSLSNCDEECPGYPSNSCGGDGFFTYYLFQQASGTMNSSGSLVNSTASYASGTKTITQTPSVSLVTVTRVDSSSTSSSGATGSSNANQSKDSSSSSMSTGAIIGIVVAVVVVIVLCILGFVIYKRRRANKLINEYKNAAAREKTANSYRIDQRLEPVMLQRPESSGSMDLSDEQDYSRKILRITNPDG